MSGTFAKLLNPLDPAKTAVLLDVVKVSREVSTPFMLFGAFARDVHFFHAYGVEITRKTEDVDVSIQVKDWDAYHRFSKALQRDGRYVPESDAHPEKLVNGQLGQELDLLPFGEIAEGGFVRWPLDDSPWSVIGFDEAFSNAATLRIDDDAEVAVATIPALVALKIVAMHDRPADRKSDSVDIAFIVANYLAAGNRHRLVEGVDADILPSSRSDLDLASATLIGRDMARFLEKGARALVVTFLEHEVESDSRCYLIRGMTGKSFDSFGRAREIVAALLRGVKRDD